MRSSLIFLGYLDDADVAWMRQAGDRVSREPGELVVDSGITNHDIFLLLDGKCRVEAPNGMPLDAIHSGDLIGEVSYVDKRRTTARVCAESRVTLAHFSGRVLGDKLATDTAFAARFYRATASVLAYRLRRNIQIAITGETDVLDDAGVEFAGEIDPVDLDMTAKAGARLTFLLQALS
jgi:CRP/FNR family cyclic AMP-dependent transcriptional regulator